MSEATSKLIKLVDKKASEQDSLSKVQKYLQNGADITACTKTGTTIVQSVIDEEKRLRPILPEKADCCLSLCRILENAASDQLAAQVFSPNGGDLNVMYELVKVRASCYQSLRYGPLGMLSCLLKQDKIPIRFEVVQFLIDSDSETKYSLTAIDHQQQTCLSIAKSNCNNCSKDIIDHMQRQFDDILNKIPLSTSPVSPNEVIEWIHRGANIEAMDKNRNTVLCNAVHANNLELVVALSKAGSRTDHRNKDGRTPLEIAEKATIKNPTLIAILKDQNVNAELKRLIETKRSQLTFEEVDALLKKGAKINATYTDNNSLLHLLIKNHGTPEMIIAFVNELNADISVMNTNGHRPIETCILEDREPFTCLLTFFKLSKMNTDLLKNSKSNKTLLQFANEQRRFGAAKIIQNELNLRLWNCMARANTNDENNKTITNEVKELIACGAQINYRHDNEEYQLWTVLHLACKTTTKNVVEYLIKDLQADYSLRNADGDYTISIAAEHGNLSIIEYLRDLPNLSFNVFNDERQTPLHLATKNHHLRVVQYLVRWGADPTAQNQSNQTPLDVALANVSKNKEEEMSDKKLIYFLEQLICPPVDNLTQLPSHTTKPNYDLDTCELAAPIDLNPIQMHIPTDDANEAFTDRLKQMLALTPNDQLHDAVKEGDVENAKRAIQKGADIRHRKNNRVPYEVTQRSMERYSQKLISSNLEPIDRVRYERILNGCREIIVLIRDSAYKNLVDAIDHSDARLVMEFHLAGAPLTVDLLKRACGASNNVEIVDYLIRQNNDIYQALITDSSPGCSYHIAKAKHFDRTAAYIKYLLSFECTKAVKENNVGVVKRLVCAGASVDMHDTNNLDEALRLENIELIQILCDNGAKIPVKWLMTESIVLGPDVRQQLKSEKKIRIINRCLIHRRLRFAAASGDIFSVIKCQRLGADINSMNCYGSTALLCSLQHGKYFRVVHALISCGASMLHSNVNELESLIVIAQNKGYTQIANYLLKELNEQFLSSITNDDRQRAKKYTELGANLNYQDEQKRTALHYAVHHDVELVKWLCELGTDPTICDNDGDYSIIQATKKGDYAMVRFFVKNYPTTKSLTDKDGLTALQIAQKLKFARISKLIETGEDAPESLEDSEISDAKIKHDRHTLIEACRNGRIKTIQEFIEQHYESKEEKRKLCFELIHVAENANSFEIVDLLKIHYESLKTELPSDMQSGSYVILNERYKKILYAYLSGLSTLIANSPTILDPDDPNTYLDLFSSLIDKTEKRSQELQQVKSEQDVKRLIDNDAIETNNKLKEFNEKLEEYCYHKEMFQARILEIDENLSKQSELIAFERKKAAKEREDCKKQLAIYESSIKVAQLQQEAMLNRQKTINFIKGNICLAVFYRTIENRLQLLFEKILKNQSGCSGTAATSHLINEAVFNMKGVLGPILSRQNSKVYKKEFYHISKLGNIGELQRIASETAGFITLYYRQQIEMIDPLQRIKVGTIFNEKIGWLKHIFDRRSEISEEKIIILVADYITAWIIDGLTAGKDEIISTGSLSQQLWLHVAKSDLINYTYRTKTYNIVEPSAGQQIIPTTINKSTKQPGMKVPLQYLFGYVSVLGGDGHIYQCSIPGKPSDQIMNDFGYVYVQPFSSDKKALESIIEGRKLQRVKQNIKEDILTKFDDIIQYAPTLTAQNDQYIGQSSMTTETTNQVIEILCRQNIFVTSNDLEEKLGKTEETIELNIDVLQEDNNEKVEYYRFSIEAAHKQIEMESETNRETMKKDNNMHFEQVKKQLNEQFQQMEKRLEQFIEKRMNDISNDLQQQAQKIYEIAKIAESQSRQALERSNQGIETSDQAVQKTKQAVTSAQNSERMIEKQRHDLEIIAENLTTSVKQTANEQKQLFENAISVTRAKVGQDFERAREDVQQAKENVKISAKSAQNSLSTIKDLQKITEDQLEIQRKETKRVNAEAKETRQLSENAAADARKAEGMIRRTAEVVDGALDKMNRLHEKVEKALV